MMIGVSANERRHIAPLFQEIRDSMVIAYLQGYMGNGYVDRLPDPTVGLIVSGEYSFWAGDAASPAAREMAERIFEYTDGAQTTAIYGDDDYGWRGLLLSISENNPMEIPRCRIAQKDYDFDRTRLQNFISAIPNEFVLRQFDKELYGQAMAEEWSREFCETFASAEAYLSQGFGFGVIHKSKLVAGASSWDAASLVSKHMALKLGYEYLGEYSTVHMSSNVPCNHGR